jgi:hypothetical protein
MRTLFSFHIPSSAILVILLLLNLRNNSTKGDSTPQTSFVRIANSLLTRLPKEKMGISFPRNQSKYMEKFFLKNGQSRPFEIDHVMRNVGDPLDLGAKPSSSTSPGQQVQDRCTSLHGLVA